MEENKPISVEIVEENATMFSMPSIRTTLGTITCDLAEFKKQVTERIKECASLVLSDENEKFIKDTKATINNAIDYLKAQKKSIIAEFNKPLLEFNSNIDEIVKEMESASDTLKQQLDEAKKVANKMKLDTLESFYDGILESKDIKGKENLKFEKLINPKWTNKTCLFKDACNEIVAMIEVIKANVEAIVTITDDDKNYLLDYYEMLEYSNAGNNGAFNALIGKWNIRQAQIQKAKEMEKREMENASATQPKVEVTEKSTETQVQASLTNATEDEEEIIVAFEIKATRSTITQVSNFLVANKIKARVIKR